MVRRMLTVLGLALFALALVAPAASAQYVDDGSLTTDNPNPGPGDTVTVTGTACGEPNVAVTITATQGGQSIVIGQATTGPDGTYTATVTIPNSFTDGAFSISDSCGAVLNIGGVVTTAATLPRTGSSNTGTLWRVAVALVAAGGLLVLMTRKRSARVHVEA